MYGWIDCPFYFPNHNLKLLLGITLKPIMYNLQNFEVLLPICENYQSLRHKYRLTDTINKFCLQELTILKDRNLEIFG